MSQSFLLSVQQLDACQANEFAGKFAFLGSSFIFCKLHSVDLLVPYLGKVVTIHAVHEQWVFSWKGKERTQSYSSDD